MNLWNGHFHWDFFPWRTKRGSVHIIFHFKNQTNVEFTCDIFFLNSHYFLTTSGIQLATMGKVFYFLLDSPKTFQYSIIKVVGYHYSLVKNLTKKWTIELSCLSLYFQGEPSLHQWQQFLCCPLVHPHSHNR